MENVSERAAVSTQDALVRLTSLLRMHVTSRKALPVADWRREPLLALDTPQLALLRRMSALIVDALELNGAVRRAS